MEVILRGQKTYWDIENGRWVCRIKIHHPFYYKGSQCYSLSDQIVNKAIERNATVEATVEGKLYKIAPTKKGLKQKKKEGMIETVPTKFSGMKDWFRVWYKIENKLL